MYDLLRELAKKCSEEPEDWGKLPYGAISEIKRENFYEIEERYDDREIFYVDGGSNRIYLSPKQGVYVVRIYVSSFSGTRKIYDLRSTNIVYIKNLGNSSSVEIHNLEGERYLQSSLEIDNASTQNSGGELMPTIIAQFVRKSMEWLAIKSIAKKNPKCIIIKDGSLQSGTVGESEYMREAAKAVEDSNAKLIGVAKTSSLTTTKGYAVSSILMHLSRKFGVKAPWIYYPIFQKGEKGILGEVAFGCYHSLSEYVFRTDFYNMDFSEFKEIAELISFHSSDAYFYGYPYGLIDADVNARVSDEEAKELREIFDFMLEDFGRFERNATNAHDLISEVK